jgi:hypothetical protein
MNIVVIFAPTIADGDVAQSVEQRTENPCVGGSIPSITTEKKGSFCFPFLFFMNSKKSGPNDVEDHFTISIRIST